MNRRQAGGQRRRGIYCSIRMALCRFIWRMRICRLSNAVNVYICISNCAALPELKLKAPSSEGDISRAISAKNQTSRASEASRRGETKKGPAAEDGPLINIPECIDAPGRLGAWQAMQLQERRASILLITRHISLQRALRLSWRRCGNAAQILQSHML